MFKKLLNLFGSGKSDDKATDTPSSEELENTFPTDDDDDDDDSEEDDDDDNDDDVDFDDDDDDTDSDNDGDDDNYDDDYNENTNNPVVKRLAGKKADLDSDTLHGNHYTVEEFDEEIKRRVDRLIKSEQEDGETVTEKDIFSMTTNAMDEVYCDWNGFPRGHDAMINFRNRHSKKYLGHASFGYEKMEDNVDNPLLEPIHGVTLEDYAAVSYKIASGADFNSIMEALGVDPAIWAEVSTLWGKRMQEDTTFTVTTLFGQLYNTADQHPKLNALQVETSDKGKETIEKMRKDRFFYEELQAARTAAFEYGIDGSQWIMDNYGVSLGEFQKVATYHSELDQKDFNMERIKKYSDYMDAKIEEYKKKFAEEQGGNVADDINF